MREYLGALPETWLLSSGYGRAEVERYLEEREITIVDKKISESEILEVIYVTL